MKIPHLRRTIFAVTASLFLTVPLAAKAELFADGLMGIRLGQTRVEAMTALVDAGVVPDLEKAQCSDKVPDKTKAVANRICKLTLQPGSQYAGLALDKVTFLYQDEAIVLVGFYVSSPTNSYEVLRSTFKARLGEAAKEKEGASAIWQEPATPEAPRATQVHLWADSVNAFMVYSYADVQ